MSKQDVNKSLYRIAARCVNEGQYTLAIQCFLAILGNDPVPDDYVLCTLDLARMYIDHTTNGEEAQKLLKQLLVRLKEDNTRVDERCSCCSLLIRASLEEGDLQAAQKHCVRAFTVLERAHIPTAQLFRWWLHFGCIAAITSCQRPSHTASEAQRDLHMSVVQSWRAHTDKALQMLAASPAHVAQLLCALLQAQLVSVDLGMCLQTLKQLQEVISRWQKDGSQHQLEVLSHALTLQALLMVRESKLDVCWDVPLCVLQGQARQTAASGPQPAADAAPPSGPPQIGVILDEVMTTIQQTKGAPEYNWLPMRQRAGLLMLLRGVATLSHHSAGTDTVGNRALYYAEMGLKVLQGESGEEQGPFLKDLLIMLTSIVFLFNMTVFSGKDEDDHLRRAQRALATMQECTRPAPQPSQPPAEQSGGGGANGGGAGGATRAVESNGAAPPAAATFVRFCTATYAICMGCMQDAVGILRQALRDSPLPEALSEANSPHGNVHPSHRLLLLLVLCTLSAALADCDTAAARTEAEALQSTIQRVAEGSGNQVGHIIAALARARCWRRGREPHDSISVGDSRFAAHRAAILSAFQVSSEFAVPRTQLVVAALRALAPMLTATGDGAGADRALKSALTMLNASRDGTARVQVLRDYAAFFLTDDRRTAIAHQRTVKYAQCIRQHLGSTHASLVAWGLDRSPA